MLALTKTITAQHTTGVSLTFYSFLVEKKLSAAPHLQSFKRLFEAAVCVGLNNPSFSYFEAFKIILYQMDGLAVKLY